MKDGYLQVKMQEMEEKINRLENQSKQDRIVIDTLSKTLKKHRELISGIQGVDIDKMRESVNTMINDSVIKQKKEMIDKSKKLSKEYYDKSMDKFGKSLLHCIKLNNAIVKAFNDNDSTRKLNFLYEFNHLLCGKLITNGVLKRKDVTKMKKTSMNKAEKKIMVISDGRKKKQG